MINIFLAHYRFLKKLKFFLIILGIIHADKVRTAECAVKYYSSLI